jgi:hypothetical protein
MSGRARIVVATGWFVAAGGALLVFIVRAGSGFTSGSTSLVFAGLTVAIVSDASVGAVLMIRRPGNVVGRILMLTAVMMAVTLLGWVSGAALTETRGRHDFQAGVATLIGALGFTPSLFVAGPLLALLFPSGRLPSVRWRWPVGALVVAIAAGSAAGLFHPGPVAATLTENPFAVSGYPGLEAFWTIGIALLLVSLPVAMLLAIAAVIVRFRLAHGVERAQLKWFVAANVAVGAFLILGFADGGYLGLAAGASPTFLDILAYASLSLPAVAVGVAILRYRLFEIDRIISRTIAWAVVTGVLGAVFAGTVVGLQSVLSNVTQGETLAVAGSTLVAFAIFQPVRLRVQSIVDRRFNRARYDAERTATAFAGRQRDQTNIAGLRVDLVGTIDSALHPQAIGVWIRTRNETRTQKA